MTDKSDTTRADATLAVGQIWKPTQGRAFPKVIVSLGKTGMVYAAKHPRIEFVLPTGFSSSQWRLWVRRHAVKPDRTP